MAFTSCQSFVQALRSTSDPPTPGGPTKLEIAKNAWASSSLLLADKAEIIVDWILTRMLKTTSKTDTLLSVEHWALLANTLVSSESRPDSDSLESWLLPVLNRIPLPVIFVNLFDHVSEEHGELMDVVFNCMRALWPLSVPKHSVESLLDVFGAILRVIVRCHMIDHLADVTALVASSIQAALDNTSSRKRASTVFLQAHLQSWLEGMYITQSQSLFDIIYATGAEFLFNVDTLRQPSEPLLTAILASPFIFHALPRLLKSYINAARKSRSVIFTGSNANVHQEVRIAGLKFFVSCQALVLNELQSSEAWRARSGLLSVVDEENIFQQGDDVVGEKVALETNARQALDVLIPGNEEIATVAMEILCKLGRISMELILPFIPQLLPKLFLIHALPSCFEFLEQLLDYHAKTRTLDSYLFSLVHSIVSLSKFPENGYHVAWTSPVMLPTHLDRLSRLLSRFLTPGQITKSEDLAITCLRRLVPTQPDENRDAKKKQKRNVKSKSCHNPEGETEAIKRSLCARFVDIIWTSLPLTSRWPIARLELKQSVLMLCEVASLKRLAWGRQEWHEQIVTAAQLRLRLVLQSSTADPSTEQDPVLACTILSKAISDEKLLPELLFEIFQTVFALCANGNTPTLREPLEMLIQYLKDYFDPSIVWSGRCCDLSLSDSGRRKCALALFKSALEYWLPIIDSHASGDQLRDLMGLVLLADTTHTTMKSSDTIYAGIVVFKALQSAQFWELRNIRSAILSLVDKATSKPESLNLRALLALKPSNEKGVIDNTVANTCKSVSSAGLNNILDMIVQEMSNPAYTKQRLYLLEYISKRCCDRPTSLRTQERDGIWSLLAQILQKSTHHDTQTSPTVFHAIVAVLSGLIRLRRDLVVHNLSHLCHVFCRLVFALRSLEPCLGGKQSRLVTDSLPVWINATVQPLGAAEAKALARLLSTLATKTVPRMRGAASEQPLKLESLALPFAKHAGFVLKAYIEASNDPLCVLSSDVRRELLPGLFSLCDMLKAHDRDFLMVALDAGGKATMQLLWTEYVKQKYTGKG